MALPTWEFLSKSQTDNEKVEEAILRLILEHNNDEEAHLSEGQSLQSHKASEIIDHLIESIVEDKIADGAISSRCITSDQIIGKDFRTSANVGASTDGVKFNSSGIEMWKGGVRNVSIPATGDPEFTGALKVKRIENTGFFFQTQFESIDGWDTVSSGAYSSVSASICYLNIVSGDTDGDYMQIYSEFGGATINWTNDDPTFEAYAKLYNKTKGSFYLIVGNADVTANHNRFGFLYLASTGSLYCLTANSSNRRAQQIYGIDVSEWHRYRCEKIGSSIYYYIDGVLVYTATTELPSGDDDYVLLLKLRSIASPGSELLVRNVQVSTQSYL